MNTHIVWFKWTIKENLIQTFLDGWEIEKIKHEFIWKMHKSSDNCLHLYTKWESKEKWEEFQSNKKSLLNSSMQECVLHTFDPVFMMEINKMEKKEEHKTDEEEKKKYLNVKIIEAKGLCPKSANGVSNPYCVLKIHDQLTQKSQMKVKTLEPKFNEEFLFWLTPSTSPWYKRRRFLLVKIKNSDYFTNKELGSIKIDLWNLKEFQKPKWVPLLSSDFKKNKERGEVLIQITEDYLPEERPLLPWRKQANKENQVLYKDIRDTLQTGDIILFSSVGLLPSIIKFYTGSTWSHIGMVVLLKEFDLILLWESHPNPKGSTKDFLGQSKMGVQLVSLSSKLQIKYYKKIAVRKLNVNRTPEIMNILFEFMKEVKEKPFTTSVSEFIISGGSGRFGVNKFHLDSLFCSGLVAEAYQRMGLLDTKLSSNNYCPGDFTSMNLLNGYLEPEVYIKRYYNKSKKTYDLE